MHRGLTVSVESEMEIPGGKSYIKERRCSYQILNRKKLIREFYRRGLKFFLTPNQEVSILKQHIISCLYFVLCSILPKLNRTAKVPAIEVLRLNTLRGTKTTFFTPVR